MSCHVNKLCHVYFLGHKSVCSISSSTALYGAAFVSDSLIPLILCHLFEDLYLVVVFDKLDKRLEWVLANQHYLIAMHCQYNCVGGRVGETEQCCVMSWLGHTGGRLGTRRAGRPGAGHCGRGGRRWDLLQYCKYRRLN
jgi:hypothetical protein